MKLPFVLALLSLSFGTALFPHLHLHWFAPFLALALFRGSFISALWMALIAGLITDLFCSELPFGLSALSFTLMAVLLSTQRRNFFEESPLSFSSFTALVSSFCTGFQILFFLLLGKKLPLSIQSLATDLVLMPLFDGVFAFVWFVIPLHLIQRIFKSLPIKKRAAL